MLCGVEYVHRLHSQSREYRLVELHRVGTHYNTLVHQQIVDYHQPQTSRVAYQLVSSNRYRQQQQSITSIIGYHSIVTVVIHKVTITNRSNLDIEIQIDLLPSRAKLPYNIPSHSIIAYRYSQPYNLQTSLLMLHP